MALPTTNIYETLARVVLPEKILDVFEVTSIEEENTGVIDETGTEAGKEEGHACAPMRGSSLQPCPMETPRWSCLPGHATYFPKVSAGGLKEMCAVKDCIKGREEDVLNYFVNRSTNAASESNNARMKGFRSELRGVRDLDFYLYRCVMIFG